MLRDEAHRFALKNHRDLRGKRTLTSSLDDIPGVGPKRRNALLQLFGSVQRIREAAIEEIAAVPGFSPKLAEEIKSCLQEIADAAAKTGAQDAATNADSALTNQAIADLDQTNSASSVATPHTTPSPTTEPTADV